MNSITIRKMNPEEYSQLENFLYEAIYVPFGVDKPDRSIIKNKELQLYIESFGKNDDNCLVAVDKNKIVGACWTRIMNDYGHIDDETPSLAISLYEEYRGRGIGTKLMHEMLEELRNQGYKKVSLSVQKVNYAFKMYKKIGFQIIDENKEEYIMVYDLTKNVNKRF